MWSYDFVSAYTHDGRSVRLLNPIDEYSRACLLICAERRWTSARVIEALADVMVKRGVPEHIRSDNGPEFVAKDLRQWLINTGAKTLYIEHSSPWENGYCESFNSKLRDEFLNGEIFYSFKELRVLVERWQMHYNTVRPHSSLGYKPPAPEAWLATEKGHGEVETAARFPLLHPPRLRRLSELRGNRATLTLHWHKTSGRPMRASQISYQNAVRAFQRHYIIEALMMHGCHLGRMAEKLGMHRNTLTRTLRELDVDVRQIRDVARLFVRPSGKPNPSVVECNTQQRW